ncbi:adhesion G-protein coupled receptor F1 [Ctenopharyngodon idella]|uniref:adhesion G-protein coupled receptor F1 n=1 Tax=Ctenopharyngodon idella TaxID=7959 RepID=UPI0022303A64|nr:adhesion G-protein coupled receptor F1 [Ctenopharyngodon idella]
MLTKAVFEQTWCQTNTSTSINFNATLSTTTLSTTTLSTTTLSTTTLSTATLSTTTLSTTTLSTATLSTATLSTTTLSTATLSTATLSTSTLQSTSQKPTTTARQSTTVSKPNLVCENKGTLQNGICLCPDDWTGTTCSISGIPEASALCNISTHLFGPPNIISGATADQVFELASSTQILTSIPERLTANNITNAAKITSILLSHPQSVVDSTLSLNNFACVFWNYDTNDWNTEGCTKTNNPSGRAVCNCKPNTLKNTNFAILMAFDINYQYSEALHWISITGCALSIVGLFVTAVYQIITRKSRGGSPTLLIVNICISMTVFYLFFIFGINNPVQHLNVAKLSDQNTVPDSDQHKYPDEGPCTAFTALLHYFLLATFTWNTLSRKTPLKKKILSSFSLAVMLGLSWVIGYILLITHETTLKFILSVVFCLFNTTQGVQIFILFSLRPIINANPAFMDSLRISNVGFHRKTFALWKNKIPESNESYKSNDSELA